MLYKVDHYPCMVNETPFGTVEIVKYWNQLFGHNREGVWKGMVEMSKQEIVPEAKIDMWFSGEAVFGSMGISTVFMDA